MSTPSPQTTREIVPDIEPIRALVAEDLARVDRCIQNRLRSEVALVNRIGEHIVAAGGKRLRPMLVLLAARACGYTGEQHVPLAAVVEFIHTATLLHDDVVDESGKRRGRDTANACFGNAASVLVGDFLYSRAFQMMVQADSMRVMDIMADTTNTIAEGEVMQLMHSHDPATSEARYLQVIERKTAKLFEAASRLGAVLAQRPAAIETALADYGLHLGMAFQIADDTLDYDGDTTTLGKNAGDDLAEGKPTLPLIYALKNSNSAQAATLRRAIETGSREYLSEVLHIIEATGALQYASDYAAREAALAHDALKTIPASTYRDALSQLTDYAVARTY